MGLPKDPIDAKIDRDYVRSSSDIRYKGDEVYGEYIEGDHNDDGHDKHDDDDNYTGSIQ